MRAPTDTATDAPTKASWRLTVGPDTRQRATTATSHSSWNPAKVVLAIGPQASATGSGTAIENGAAEDIPADP